MTAEQREELKRITDEAMRLQSQLEAFTVDCPEALDAFEALDLCTDELYDLQPRCDECGDPSDGGEGWNGLCGNCADKAERRRRA